MKILLVQNHLCGYKGFWNGNGKGWGGEWFDFLAAASDPAKNVAVNLERCPVLCRAASLINISEGGSENDGIYFQCVTLFCLRITYSYWFRIEPPPKSVRCLASNWLHAEVPVWALHKCLGPLVGTAAWQLTDLKLATTEEEKGVELRIFLQARNVPHGRVFKPILDFLRFKMIKRAIYSFLIKKIIEI